MNTYLPQLRRCVLSRQPVTDPNVSTLYMHRALAGTTLPLLHFILDEARSIA